MKGCVPWQKAVEHVSRAHGICAHGHGVPLSFKPFARLLLSSQLRSTNQEVWSRQQLLPAKMPPGVRQSR